MVHHLHQHPELNLADVAYTYQVGRVALNHRRMLVCPHPDLTDAASALEQREPHRLLTHVVEPKDRALVFMFPGQGTQYVDMARELYQTEPTFRAQVEQCSELLRPPSGI